MEVDEHVRPGIESGQSASGGENGSGNSGSDSRRQQVESYLEQLRQRRLENRAQSDTVSGDERAKDGRNVRPAETGAGGDNKSAGGLSDGAISGGRGVGTTPAGRGKNRASDGGPDSSSAANSGGVKAKKNDGVKLIIPPAAKSEDKKNKTVAAVLSDKEIKEYHDDMRGLLRVLFEWQDDFISFTNRDHAKADIWKQIDAEDTAKIASALLSLGKRHAGVATSIRGLVKAYVYLEAGLITTQKFWETFRFYREHHGFTIPGIL